LFSGLFAFLADLLDDKDTLLFQKSIFYVSLLRIDFRFGLASSWNSLDFLLIFPAEYQ